jgi:short-subunit dehydrogenase
MFDGKVAIVTGASSGIGLSVARKLVAEGAKVALVARTKDALERIARELCAVREGSAAAFPCDVKDLETLRRLPGLVAERFGGLDILVNNAGLNHRGPIARHAADALADIITTNLTAPIFLTRAALDHLRPGGAVIQVASLAGMVPVPGEATYCASKAGLRAFARALDEELAAAGIHSGIVSPGPVDTGFFAEIDEVPALVFSQPMSTAEQVADAVLACIRTRVTEIVVPAASGYLATAAYVLPKLAVGLRPLLERKGAKAKRAYMAKKGRPQGSAS